VGRRTSMTDSRQSFTGRDVAGAGLLMLAINLACAAAGAGIGALVGAFVPLLLAGFAVGFFLGMSVVVKRFRDV